ncbi:hypothetical protein IMCC21906_02162 [Spongiibacter sp. IMCC21906]|nr:hypothetical protein IMCC21906_02162 [Spongiibacter sp. IMCC21906]
MTARFYVSYFAMLSKAEFFVLSQQFALTSILEIPMIARLCKDSPCQSW